LATAEVCGDASLKNVWPNQEQRARQRKDISVSQAQRFIKGARGEVEMAHFDKSGSRTRPKEVDSSRIEGMDSFWIVNSYRKGGAMSSGAQWAWPNQWEVQRIWISTFRMQ